VPGEFGIVLGRASRALSREAGDKVTLIAPQGWSPPPVFFHGSSSSPCGPFRIGMFEYRLGSRAHPSRGRAETLYGMGESASRRLKLHDLFQSREVTRDLITRLRGDLYVSDWTRSHANYFRAVQIEKTMMFTSCC